MSAPRRKKRAHPARRIVPRGQLGVAWVVGSLAVGLAIAAAGLWFVLQGR